MNYCLTNGNHLKCSRKPPSIIDESAVSLLHCGDGYSVYGTTDPDPINNKGLTLLNEDSTPYLENWTLLLDNVEVYKPTKAKKDVNGDGKVDEEDDLQIFTDGWSYDIKGDFPAMRYIKVVMHTNWANKPTGFRMQEISVYHNGVGETKAVKAKVPKKFKSPKWSETL
ncbi:MAG: DUF5000 domain-containing lipoprotein [Rikenellaceae bacterium]